MSFCVKRKRSYDEFFVVYLGEILNSSRRLCFCVLALGLRDLTQVTCQSSRLRTLVLNRVPHTVNVNVPHSSSSTLSQL